MVMMLISEEENKSSKIHNYKDIVMKMERYLHNKTKVILSVLFIVVIITHDACSRRKIPPLCLVGCASLWLGCEYDCRSEYQFISRILPNVMETCTNNCEQQRLTCMQHSLDPACKTTARDMTLYAAFQKKAKNGTSSYSVP